jgi:hypothetical protein
MRSTRHRLSIPAGIEKMLVKASLDREFRRALLEDRAAALETSGIRLTPLETTVLSGVPDARLRLMIEGIRPRRHGRRRIMKAVATAVVTLATGTAGVGCEEKSENADVRVDTEIPDAVGGIWPDDPLDDPDVLEDVAGDETDDTLDEASDDAGEEG